MSDSGSCRQRLIDRLQDLPQSLSEYLVDLPETAKLAKRWIVKVFLIDR